MWTCITLVSPDRNFTKVFREEFAAFQKQNSQYTNFPFLVCQNPTSNVGDGGASLNALLVTAEQICNIRGLENVLKD